MNNFNYYQPTEIVFGKGCINDVGRIAAKYGKVSLIVTGPANGSVHTKLEIVKRSLENSGMTVIHFDGVCPNPTTDIVTAGAKLAVDNNVDVVIGLGGGSSMDTAKAIAVEATHEGTAWDYLFYKKSPTTKTLPIIAISTTSGTGSQTTPCAVLTKSENKDKSAIWHSNIFAKVAIVDPDLMLSLPYSITATTGFDAFTHNFEAYLSINSNPYVECLAINGLRTIIENLPALLSDLDNISARMSMAWADTLGGLCISSAGVTLPHGIGMQISGHCPQVAHGQSLAVTYPEFTRFTWGSSIKKFAIVGRLFNSELIQASDEAAAQQCCFEIDDFLKKIGLWTNLKDLGVSLEQIREISNKGQVLSDYKNNPRCATIEEMYVLLMNSYERK